MVCCRQSVHFISIIEQCNVRISMMGLIMACILGLCVCWTLMSRQAHGQLAYFHVHWIFSFVAHDAAIYAISIRIRSASRSLNDLWKPLNDLTNRNGNRDELHNWIFSHHQSSGWKSHKRPSIKAARIVRCGLPLATFAFFFFSHVNISIHA